MESGEPGEPIQELLVLEACSVSGATDEKEEALGRVGVEVFFLLILIQLFGRESTPG